MLLSDDAIQKLVDITNGYLLHNDIYPSTDATEYCTFLAHTLLVSRFGFPLDTIFEVFLRPLSIKHGFHAMELKRFQDLYQCTHGYAIEDHERHFEEEEEEDDAWLERRSVLRKMEELERSLFEPSMKFMLNRKSGLLSIDGERLSWRDRDEMIFSVTARVTMKRIQQDRPVTISPTRLPVSASGSKSEFAVNTHGKVSRNC